MSITMQPIILPSALATLVLVMAAGWWSEHASRTANAEMQVEVAGTVTLDSQPLKLGEVCLSRDDGHSIRCQIVDGIFKVPRVPTGPWRIGIRGEAVPVLYHVGELANITCRSHEFRFGLKGTEQLKALSLGRRTHGAHWPSSCWSF